MSEISRRISIKWNVFFTFLFFSGILLLVLWVLQILFLDHIYSYIKTEKMKTNVESIISCLEDEDYVELLDDYTRANDLNLMIIDENFRHTPFENEFPDKQARRPSQSAFGRRKYEISTIYDDAANSANGETSAVYSSFGVGSRHCQRRDTVVFTTDGEAIRRLSSPFPNRLRRRSRVKTTVKEPEALRLRHRRAATPTGRLFTQSSSPFPTVCRDL